jgi:hypothetical protein
LREKLLLDRNAASCIAFSFLSGVALKVLESILYKAISWYPYYRELENDKRDKWWYRMSDFVHKHYLIDFAFDVATVAAFGYATYRVFRLIMGNP